jgi:3-oxoadipate enol-lactonase
MENLKNNSTSSDLLYFTEHGSGRPLLLVHGLMMSGEMFEPALVEHFATRHRVIIPDLRGHGRSRGLPPPYGASQLASDLSHLLDHLGIDSTAVLGYSHGGAIAQQLALDDPKRCNRLVLACTYAYNMATTREWIEDHLALLFIRVLGLKRFANLAVSQGMPQVDKERANRLADIIRNQDLKLMLTAWREMMVFDSRKRVAEIRCPTLVIAGSNDKGVPAHHAKMLHGGIPGSRLVLINGADHTLILAHPDEFMRVTDEFLVV